jgi:hypothetical protein
MGFFEAWGATSGKARGRDLRGTYGGQVGGYFPAALLAFDRHRSGALEDITGASHPDGEPPVFGTP